MLIGIRHKLFLAFAVTAALVVAALLLWHHWSFNYGFLDYVNKAELAKLDALRDDLEAGYSDAQGWSFIDPWTSYRDVDGSYLPGTAFEDGVHPSADTAAAVGTFVADWIAQRSAKLQQ